jgi:biopolymer transport protein TolR
VSRRGSKLLSKQISDINLTPLIDLSFLLLIAFVITYPMIEQGIPVNLPKAAANDITDDKPCSVTLNAQGELFVDQTRVSLDQLRSRLAELRGLRPEFSVLVRADEALAYGKVVQVLKILHELRITKMALVTEAESP